MKREFCRLPIKSSLFLVFLVCWVLLCGTDHVRGSRPNILVIFADDQGSADWELYRTRGSDHLYDLNHDPGETLDVAEEHSDTADALRHRLDHWLAALPEVGQRPNRGNRRRRNSTPPDGPSASTKNPRLIILADMGNEPDEEQQMAHMLVNCNEFHLEGLVAVTGKFLNEASKDEYKRVVHPELFHRLIDGYSKVESNLRLHDDGWPTAQYLRGIVCSGQPKYGLADVGAGKTSEGSSLITRSILKDDPRPINIVVNAGSNTLAQALFDLRSSSTKSEMDHLIKKLRVFENGAQDNCGAWICHEFPEIHWIRSNHQTYGYMGQARSGAKAVGPWCWKPFPRTHQGQHRWAETHIMVGHGAIGELYPYRFGGKGFVEGGGTVPWLGLVNKGLYDIDQPSWGGWSGRFGSRKQSQVWSRHASVRKDEESYGDFAAYTEAIDRWVDSDGTTYENEFAAVWRWRRDIMNNCQARFDWCVKPFEQANHHPRASVAGDMSDEIVMREAEPGEKVTFNASASKDPDDDELIFRWYFYPEAGTYRGDIPPVHGGDESACSFVVPADATGKQLHMILEVSDNNDIVSLKDYRRIVINIRAS